MAGEKNLRRILAKFEPKLNDGTYIFCTVSGEAIRSAHPLMQFREEEGTTWIVGKNEADKAGVKYQNVFSWITLSVHSALDSVGFTAAFTGALADHSISCNVVAGFYHDHLFIPETDSQKAMEILSNLKENLND